MSRDSAKDMDLLDLAMSRSSSTPWAAWLERWAWAANPSRCPWPTRRTERTEEVCLLPWEACQAGEACPPGPPSPAPEPVDGLVVQLPALDLDNQVEPPGQVCLLLDLQVQELLLLLLRLLDQTTAPIISTTNSMLRKWLRLKNVWRNFYKTFTFPGSNSSSTPRPGPPGKLLSNWTVNHRLSPAASNCHNLVSHLSRKFVVLWSPGELGDL